MNRNLQRISDFILQAENLSAQEKAVLNKAVEDAEKELNITAFKLDRTEKVKRTTAILLEETIEELEQKRKAVEVQNRELEIEASLERVRTVALSMQNPNEMANVCRIISQQLELLKVKDIRNVQTAIIYESKGTYSNYEYYTRHDKLLTTEVSYKTHPLQEEFAIRMLKGAGEFFSTALIGQEVKDWYNYQQTTNQFADYYLKESESLNYYMFSLGPVALGISTYSPLIEEEIILFKRFRNVFELAYRRFLDIQKAEAQAREAQIQLALERVRARAMSMQKSDELAELVDTVFKELTNLHFLLDRCIIMIFDPKTKGATWWMANPEPGAVPVGLFVRYHRHKPYQEYLNAWKARTQKWEYLLEGSNKKDWDTFIFNETDLSLLPDFVKVGMSSLDLINLNASFHNFGNLTASTKDPLPLEQFDILLRFAKVFDMTYTRFNDLKQAEAQTREAHIEVALERVRARSMAMHTSKELEDVALELRKQMGLLGQKDLEVCAIHLYDSDEHYFESWSAMRPPGSAGEMFQGLARFPKKGIRIVDELMWNYANNTRDYVLANEEEKIVEWFGVMKEYAPELFDSIIQVVGDVPIGKMKAFWSVADFAGGALVMVTYSLPDEQSRNLLRRTSNVFELAYTRFNDLKISEAHALQAEHDLIAIKEAKQRAEDALTELQVTQKQLVQSEKMASLGELTAGIAHEIQNPLNFVNNFSEVNSELIDELEEEIEKGNLEEVRALAKDIRANEQKINHHGKRADAIVKGMLQHSRSSSGVKEPTDINALADEYLRLAYHGLRAKDKSFNASMKNDFDQSIGNIEVIPQDIGRVILNLITNAFYAVTEKKQLNIPGYEPTVSVSTKRQGAKVEIRVSDNGNGIPEKVLDKIFQPFFTTKPTGEGTGLGLSLSYDIVKAHGGELKVETFEGKGTTFIIQLLA